MNDDIESFFEEIGTPEQSITVDVNYANSYRGKLPDALINYWLTHGFTRHSNGLFWIVDPDKFASVKDEWLKGTSLQDEDDYYVIARSGFGELYLWGTNTGDKYIIDTNSAWILKEGGCEDEIKYGEADEMLYSFLSFLEAIDLDIENDSGQRLFSKAVRRYGELQVNEVFGFEQSLLLDANADVDNLSKVDIFIHLSKLAQSSQREILDQDALVRKAFGD